MKGADLHIVFLYKDYNPVYGGIESHLQTLAEGLAQVGYRVSVVVCQPRGQQLPAHEIIADVAVWRVPRHIDIASNAWSWQLAARVRFLQPDIIHLQMPWPSGDVVAWLLRDIPLVVSYQSDVVRQQLFLRLYAPLLRWTLGHARAICVSSTAYAASSPWLKAHHERLHIVPLGIADPCATLPAEALPWPLPSRYILWVGRMRYYKGLSWLIEALRDVPADISLVLVGDGPEAPRLRQLATRLGVTARIVWLGSLDAATLQRVRLGARCFVFPSHLRAEAYGLALLEALACGLPAVSCDIGTATSELNRHDETGLVVPPANAGALASAITQICTDEALNARYAAAARSRYLAGYTEKMMVAHMATIYRELGAQSPAAEPC